jgi:hypothetical protein
MTEVRSLHRAVAERKEPLMKTYLGMNRFVLISMAAFASVGAVSPLDAEDRLVEGAMIVAAKEESARIANASDETLTACLTRIAARMTPQQRMTAQQICQIDETTRQLVPLVEKEGN